MPRRNRVDPFGDLNRVEDRGLFTGNRGCLVDESRDIVRHHRGNLWITCVTSFRGWRHELDKPGRWTPLFFLDDAVALAAGHRPCAFCRPDDYRSYRDALTASLGRAAPIRADEINRRLASERLSRGGGIDRARDRKLWLASIGDLPDGAIARIDGDAHLVLGGRAARFSFAGWGAPVAQPLDRIVDVITPPTSVGALANGFSPTLHPSIHR